jgi:hypothetical protein
VAKNSIEGYKTLGTVRVRVYASPRLSSVEGITSAMKREGGGRYGVASRFFSLGSVCRRLSSPTAVSVLDVSADGTACVSDVGLGRLHHATNVTSVPTIPSSTIAQGSSAPKRTNERRFMSAFNSHLFEQ